MERYQKTHTLIGTIHSHINGGNECVRGGYIAGIIEYREIVPCAGYGQNWLHIMKDCK